MQVYHFLFHELTEYALSLQCAIVESGLQDEITVNFDQSGEVLGVSIRAFVPACSGLDVPRANLTGWKTSVEVVTTVSGPM